jgi:hypothetical protein
MGKDSKMSLGAKRVQEEASLPLKERKAIAKKEKAERTKKK